MTRPLRARYGAKDNRHELLHWEHPATPLPSALLGLTDRPPGSVGPEDRWWPSVGCGPVGDWWALWWTQPDEHARRGGMVRSEVALWPLHEVGGVGGVGVVDDLLPVMESLSGQGAIALPPTELLEGLANALLSPDRGRPVLPDLDLWPGIVATLWTRLWPEARRAFCARVAVSPPQGGESVDPPWMYGVPPERVLQWADYQVIVAAAARPVPLNRAARWLVDKIDVTFDEVLTACSSMPADLKRLGQIARAADRLERLREAPEPPRALDLLRTLSVVAPVPHVAVTLKAPAVDILERGLAEQPLAFVRLLANLELERLPAPGPLERALEAWASRWAPGLSLEEAAPLLQMLSPGHANDWWRQAVRASLATGLANPDARWAKAALQWLGLAHAASVLSELLPATPDIEQRLLDAAPRAQLDKTSWLPIRQQAVKRGWSRLHAWALMQALSPREALRAQRTFPGDAFAGLALLVERLPGAAVVAAVVEDAISRPDPRLTERVGQRTAHEPALLIAMDARTPAWRSLWAAHVKAGGTSWPPGVDRDALGHGLLDAVLDGDEAGGLISSLAEDLAKVAYDHPRRAELWDALSTKGRTALLPRVTGALTKACDTGHTVPTPEPALREAVVGATRHTRPSARVFAMLVGWQVELDEDEVIRWLSSPRHSEWASVADAVGRAVQVRGWKKLALALYDRFKYSTELRPTLDACSELLPDWQRFWLSWDGGARKVGATKVGATKAGATKAGATDDTPLTNRVAELGADLAPDRLEDVWVRAGGDRGRLPSAGPPDVRWRGAATLAHNGVLRDGLATLVRELRMDFPHNPQLEELAELFADRQRHTRR